MSTKILDALLAPLSPAAFLRDYWPERAYAAHGSLERLPAALRAPQLASFEMLSRHYNGKFTFGNALVSSRTLNMENAQPELLYRMGLSLYLTELPRVVPALNDLLRAIEKELGAPANCARVGGFAAPRGNGVTCHFDGEEVFSIQLSGEKRWRIAKARDIAYPWGMQFNPGDALLDEELYAQAGEGFPDPEGAEFETIDMRPGSVLFLPRGTWHQTEAGNDSFSVSIMVRTPAALETVLAALRTRMLQDPQWRKPLYAAWSDESHAEAQWARLMDALPTIAGGLELREALLNDLSEADRLERLNSESRLQRRPEAQLVLRSVEGAMSAAVLVRDRYGSESKPLQLEVPAAMQALFRWLADRRAAFSVRSLQQAFPETPTDQCLRIAQALVRGRYLKQLWFDRLPEREI